MEGNCEQLGLKIRRKRTVLTYVAVALLAVVIVDVLAVRWPTRQTEAMMPVASSAQVKVDQVNYRLYQESNAAAPGAPLAGNNTAATLSQVGAGFRVRVGVENRTELMLAKQIIRGWSHTCAIDLNDSVYCWGDNSSGQLGNGSTSSSRVPVAVNATGALAGKTIKQISVGFDHTCVVSNDHKIYCWGRNNSGQLGIGNTSNSSIPVAVNATGALAGKTIKQVSVGAWYTCATTSDNKAYCWGINSSGQLGNNSNISSSVPVRVYAPKEMATVLANAMKLRVQYAKKTAAACQAVAAGWQDVTNNSALAYSATGPNNGTAIAANATMEIGRASCRERV